MVTAFRPKSFRPKTGAKIAPAVDDLTIVEIDSSKAKPSILVRGVSGVGKTTGIAHLLETGKNVLIVAVEAKMQSLFKHKPKIIFIGAPVKEADGSLRQPTHTEMYNRLMAFIDRLGKGEFREHNGKPIDIIAIDGLMEVANVIYRHFKANIPVSKSTGERNTYALFDEVGTKTVDFVVGCKDAASAASDLYGIPPVGIYATVGEERVETKFGDSYYKPILYGNIAPRALPFQFEAILRLVIRREDDGTKHYIAQTVGEEGGFEAKVPGNMLAAEIIDWNMNTIYEAIQTEYTGDSVNEATDASPEGEKA